MDVQLYLRILGSDAVERRLQFTYDRHSAEPRWYLKGQAGTPRLSHKPRASDWLQLLRLAKEQVTRGQLNPVLFRRILRFAPEEVRTNYESSSYTARA